jgi:ADP-heptose:LPS heptosyltransferase
MKTTEKLSAERIDLASLRSIAVVKLDHIGDLLLATPVFEALRHHCPQAKITAVVGSWSQAVLKNNPHLDAVITYDPPWFDRDHWNFDLPKHAKNRMAVARLTSTPHDLVINLRSDHCNVLLASLISTRYLLSYRNDTDFPSLITHALDRAPGQHALNQHVQLLAHIGVTVTEPTRLFPSEEDWAWASRAVPAGRVWVALFTGAGQELKKWPENNFLDLARRLSKMGLSVLLVGGEAEMPIATQLAQEIHAVNLCGKTSLQQLACVLARVHILVSNDSAPVHIAASVETPVVVITRPSVKDEFAPLGGGHAVLSAPACEIPCTGFDFRLRTDPEMKCRCINSLTVDNVELAIYKRLLERHAAGELDFQIKFCPVQMEIPS